MKQVILLSSLLWLTSPAGAAKPPDTCGDKLVLPNYVPQAIRTMVKRADQYKGYQTHRANLKDGINCMWAFESAMTMEVDTIEWLIVNFFGEGTIEVEQSLRRQVPCGSEHHLNNHGCYEIVGGVQYRFHAKGYDTGIVVHSKGEWLGYMQWETLGTSCAVWGKVEHPVKDQHLLQCYQGNFQAPTHPWLAEPLSGVLGGTIEIRDSKGSRIVKILN